MEVADWQRFERYARKVRCLVVDESATSSLLSYTLLDEIARTRVSLHVLPNLRDLTWNAFNDERVRLSLMFMHQNITRFSVRLFDSLSYSVPAFLQEVQLRMPNLTTLDLRYEFSVRRYEQEMIELFAALPKLQKVTVPVYTLTSPIVEGFARLADLETLRFEFESPVGQGEGDPVDILDFNPQIDKDAFPALFDLSLSGHLSDHTRFLTGNFSPANLTVLYTHVVWGEQPALVTRYLTAVAETCQNLTRLYLDYFGSPIAHPDDASEDVSIVQRRLCWQDLRPLLSCQKLVSFEMRWDSPLDITEDEVEEIATGWPLVETLLLNCEPMDVSCPPTLTMRALLPLARHCENLAAVGLYMNPCTDLDNATLPMHVQPFKGLKRLAVGLSPIYDTGPVTFFLSQVCPLGTEIDAGMTWPDGLTLIDSAELQRRGSDWHEMWKEVNHMLPLLTKLRMAEEVNRNLLSTQVEDLRIRNKILAETARTGLHPDGRCIIA